MDSTMLVNTLLAILLTIVGFVMVRLHKAIDSSIIEQKKLSKEMGERPTFDQAEKQAETVADLKLYQHKEAYHSGGG